MTGTEGFPPAPWGASGPGNDVTAGGAAGGTPGGGLPPLPPPAGGAGGAGTPGGRKRKVGRNAAIIGGVALLLVAVGAAASPLGAGTVSLAANHDLGAKPLNAEAAEDLVFTITDAELSDVELSFDGEPVEGTEDGDNIVFSPGDLADGEHTFSASKDGRLPGRTATSTETFTVDTTAPVITVEKPEGQAKADEPYTLRGTVEGADVLKVDDKEVDIGDDGAFSVDYETTPASMRIWAVDEAGNVTEQTATSNLRHPGMRAVHMTGLAWASDSLREPVIQMIKDKKIDTVQLDIKDEDGAVWYDSDVELANTIESDKNAAYDIDEAVKTIHDLGARVVGRIVAFRDPWLAGWAVENGEMDLVIQDKRNGNAYQTGAYGASFTNFYNDKVNQYNADLGIEAAKAGFDDIMWDYIRRPEGNPTLQYQSFPGAPDDVDAEHQIANFLEASTPLIHAEGAGVGAAVFGISAFTPGSVAQNIALMAEHMDFVNPMVYPSHWGPGEYDVNSPNSSPYDIVHRSLMDFNRQVLGTNCVVIPWLQDFSLGVSYGAAEVRKQIEAAADVGINSWLLWNASANYTASALEAGEFADNAEGELVYSMEKPGVNPGEGATDKEAATEYIKAYHEAVENDTDFVPPGEESSEESTDESSEESSDESTDSTDESTEESSDSTGESTDDSTDESADSAE